jgi:hypothetical protein
MANRGEWDVGDEARRDESLAMLRIFLYGDQVNWIPPAVVAELGGHGSAAVRAATDAALAVTFIELEIRDQQVIDEFVGRWTGRGASRSDATWLGEAWHVGYVTTAITFDLRLVRGVGGEVDGMMVRTPSDYWVLRVEVGTLRFSVMVMLPCRG